MTTDLIYALGDIHGQKRMLDNALALIEADGGPDAKIVFLGDYTDRGPDSKGVLDLLIAGQNDGRNWHFIKGNHDRFFSHWVQFGREHDPRVKSGISWLNPRLGGTATIASYGVTSDLDPAFARNASDLEVLVHFQKGDTLILPAHVHFTIRSHTCGQEERRNSK
ncbi:MAG: metallophosphoesterase, partial [Pseudomonadota bacterium]